MPFVVGLGVMVIVSGGPPGSVGAAALAIFLGLSLLLDPAAQLEAQVLLVRAASWWVPFRFPLEEEQALAGNLSATPISFLSQGKIFQKLGIINLNLSPQLLSIPR